MELSAKPEKLAATGGTAIRFIICLPRHWTIRHLQGHRRSD
ncbi:MAG: hypothetical protein N838_19890 [Thiohalocapsa sp. PB-PSB1]|nr:MAG: hypothetical protein N838_19890 [Thiohalocapsa sp. PB-PSB1]